MHANSLTTSAPSRQSVKQLALARVISAAGTHAARIALLWVIQERTGSSGWVTAVLIADIGVLGLLGPVSGWIGDRFDRRRVLIFAELAAAIVFVLLSFAHAPWVLTVGTLAASVANSPFMPSSSAALPNLAPPDDLRWANSLLAQSQNVALVIGPLVGGWLGAWAGIRWVFLVNAASFVVSAFVITQIRGSFRADAAPDADTSMRIGYRVMARHRVVRTVTIAIGLAHFTFGLAMVADPALADSFDVGSFGYAILYTGWGSAALVGAWFAGRAFRHRGAPYGVIVGLALMAGACAMIAVLPTFWAVAVLGSLGGLGSGMVFPLTTGLIQEHTADGVRARVFGAIDTVDKTVFGIGMLAGYPLVTVFGGQGAYGFTAALIGVAALLSLGLPRAVASTVVAQLDADQNPGAADGGSTPRPVARSA